MKYIINYGLTEDTVEFACLKDAMSYADERLSYTDDAVKIYDSNNNLVAMRAWYACMDGIELCENPISIGNSGFFDDWNLDL